MTGNTEFFNMGKRWSSNPDEEVDKSGYTIQFKMFDKHGDPWGNRNIISKRYQKAGTGWQLMFSNNTQVVLRFYAYHLRDVTDHGILIR